MGTKTAIITGSSKGIGLGIARELHEAGLNVVITSRNEADAKMTALEFFSNRPESAIGVAFDIEKRECFDNLINSTLDSFGQIDVLVNNALSRTTVIPLETLSDQQIESAFTFGITNIFVLCQRIFPELQKTQGNIINISSVAVERHIYGKPIYGIVKAAINQMTKVLASEWANHQVRVNTISPGFVYSDVLASAGMSDALISKYYEHCTQFHPLGRIGQPQDIGKLATFLSSDDASFITGSTFNSDGGYCVQGINMQPERANKENTL